MHVCAVATLHLNTQLRVCVVAMPHLKTLLDVCAAACSVMDPLVLGVLMNDMPRVAWMVFKCGEFKLKRDLVFALCNASGWQGAGTCRVRDAAIDVHQRHEVRSCCPTAPRAEPLACCLRGPCQAP